MNFPRNSAVSKQTNKPPGLLALAARELAAEAAKARLARYREDPSLFAGECFGWPSGESPADYQLEILRELPRRRRVAVRGPHGLGKTALAAAAILWFALTRDGLLGADWKVVTTASAWRQLDHYLWPELRKWARRLRWDQLGRDIPFNERTELLDLILKLEHGQAFAVASDKPESIEGAHADQLLYVFDEAKAIPPATWDAAEGALASGDCYALAISTPGEPQGRFYDIHSRKPGFGDWWVRHVTLEECIGAGRVNAEWAEQRKVQWGERSAVYQNRVLGEFATSDEEGVIPLAWIEAANDRWRALDESGEWGEFTCVGVDVGRGGDATVLALRHGEAIRELQRYGVADTMTVTGHVAVVLRGHGGYAAVDVIGVGAGVVDKLREDKQAVEAFNAGESTDWKDRSGGMMFANKRAAAWWNMRELLDPANGHGIALPPDDLLIGDLTTPHWRPTSGGRIMVESKGEIRKRLGHSTDDGDAVVMAFWKEPMVEHVFRIAKAGGARRREARERGRLTVGTTTYVFKA